MNETALMLNDLYESLCSDKSQDTQNIEYQRKLLKLYRFFTAFIKCWQEDESCPRIPQNIQDSDTCDFVKNSLVWLSNQGQPQVSRMFKSLIANNIDQNMKILGEYGVTETDISDINNLVDLEDPGAFYEKMQYITEQLMTPDKTGMTLLGLMASINIFFTNHLESGDVLFLNTSNKIIIVNPITAKYMLSNGDTLQTPNPITNQTQLFPGEFIINDSTSFYKMKTNSIDESFFVWITANGLINFNGDEIQLTNSPNFIHFIVNENLVQLDLFSGEIMVFGDPNPQYVSTKTNQVVKDSLSVYIMNQLYEVSLFSSPNQEISDEKTQKYMDKLNFIEDSIPLDLTSPSLL
jgi:hypothetical protein